MVIPGHLLSDVHSALISLPSANAPLSDSVVAMAVSSIIVGCGIQTFRKNLRGLRERRRQQAQLETELDTFLTRLRAVLDRPSQTDYSTALDAAPRAALEIRAMLPHGVLADHLITWWRFSLPKRIPVYDALNEVIMAYAFVEVCATRLDRRLIEAITEYNTSHKIDPLADRLDLSFLVARILGQPEELLLGKIGLSGKPLDFLRLRCVALLGSPSVAQVAQPYVEARQRLVATLDTLKESLKTQEPERRRGFQMRKVAA